LGEQIVQTEETLHGNQEESRQEKETLSGRMHVQKFPKAFQEKHLLRGFSFCAAAALQSALAAGHLHFGVYFWGLSRGAARARNAYTGVRKRPA